MVFHWKILLFLAILLNLESEAADVDKGLKLNTVKIIGGSDAPPHSYPYQVGISIKSPLSKKGWCGGALISENFVLTAAHCLKGVESATVLVGTHNLTDLTGAQKFEVTKRDLIIHAGWSVRSVVNDIALIKLSDAAELSAHARPVALPRPLLNASDELRGVELVATGWGRVSADATIKRPDLLQHIKLTVVADDECLALYKLFDPATNICLQGTSNETACRGDSGGPVVHEREDGRRILVGIISYGRKCQSPTVLTRVRSYLEWIDERIKME